MGRTSRRSSSACSPSCPRRPWNAARGRCPPSPSSATASRCSSTPSRRPRWNRPPRASPGAFSQAWRAASWPASTPCAPPRACRWCRGRPRRMPGAISTRSRPQPRWCRPGICAGPSRRWRCSLAHAGTARLRGFRRHGTRCCCSRRCEQFRRRPIASTQCWSDPSTCRSGRLARFCLDTGGNTSKLCRALTQQQHGCSG
mmetsp:Transcript_21518/g.73745  ORF Transcript_21518/g.73745 Transcript_21518/m.73745 type:complete len:200 (-) Transcript_21518:13-612(-)